MVICKQSLVGTVTITIRVVIMVPAIMVSAIIVTMAATMLPATTATMIRGIAILALVEITAMVAMVETINLLV